MKLFRYLIAATGLLFFLLLMLGSQQVFGQTYSLAPFAQQFFDSSGDPLSGGKLYSYLAGTTTGQATYSNSTGTANGGAGCTLVSTCLVLDSAGRGTAYLSSANCYKLVLTTSADVVLRTQDNVCAYAPASGISGAIVGTTSTQTLSNKTLDNSNIITTKDGNFTICDDVTTTKCMRFENTNIGAASTRLVSIPNANTIIPIASYPLTLNGPTAARTYTLPNYNATLTDSVEVSFHGQAAAGMVDQSFFVATQAYQVTAARLVCAVAEVTAGSLYVQVTKDTGTDAPGAGTDLLTNNTNNGFDGKGTANTVQTGTLTATTASLQLAAGDRLSVDFSAAATELVGCTLTVTLKRI